MKTLTRLAAVAAALALTAAPAFAADLSPDLRTSALAGSSSALIADCTSDTPSSRAVRACTKASRLANTSEVKGELIARRGLHRLALGQYEKAGTDFERAGSLTGDTSLASLGTGFAAMMEQDQPRARAAFDDCRTAGPLAPLAQLGLGMSFQMSGETTEAREAYSRALDLRPGWDAAAEQLASLG